MSTELKIRRTSELMFPDEMAIYIGEHGEELSDGLILDLLRVIDDIYVKRFGSDPYDKLINKKFGKHGT